MDQTALGIDANMDFQAVGAAFRAAVVPLFARLCLVHLWIPLSLLVFRGTWRGNQGGIDDDALLHGHATGLEMGLHRLLNAVFCKAVDFHVKFVILQQVAEGQNRGLIRDTLADHVDPRETSHGRYLNQGVLHRWITQEVPVLQQVDPEHGFQWGGWAASFGTSLGVVTLNQFDQRLPWHHCVHLCRKFLATGLLFRRALLVITKAQLLATHQSSPGLRSEPYSRLDRGGFPVSP